MADGVYSWPYEVLNLTMSLGQVWLDGGVNIASCQTASLNNKTTLFKAVLRGIHWGRAIIYDYLYSAEGISMTNAKLP